MNPQKWQKVKELFNQAVDLPLNERPSFLAESCREDEEIRFELEKMLAFADEEDDRLEENAFDYLSDDKNSLIPEKIGVYKILREIGRGGMGVVYEAVRETRDFKQKVALKVIKRGMDTDAILSRFRHEQQILASLVHPNIARFLDGGMTADGLAFYAMEYVEGQPLDDFVEKENSGINERLKIFREICSAVQFAHKNFVIHRDLKPSNIIVSPEGTPKLLDFGISKILSEESDSTIGTATALGMMTPAYASPEQIRGERVNTATDIYSLGVILCELLTGQKPYRVSSNRQPDLIKAICESEPLRPSSLVNRLLFSDNNHYSTEENHTVQNKGQRTKDEGQKTNPKPKIQNLKSLRGDLDNIILKALRKEPENRYASVEQFSEDIHR
jgi:serine/threonine protein kinase